jgi:uncharacterized protein (TIGR03790 family)
MTPVSGALALEPGEVLVVANTAVSPGIELASYYMKQRGIPGENSLQVWIPDDETISRNQYGKKLTVLANSFWHAVDNAGLSVREKTSVGKT